MRFKARETEVKHFALAVAAFAVILMTLSFPSDQADSGELQGSIIQAVPGQVDTYTFRINEGSAFQVSDIVQVERAGHVLVKAVVTSVKGGQGTITTLGSPASIPASGDAVVFVSHGKSSRAQAVTQSNDDKEIIRKDFKWKYKGIEFICQLDTSRGGYMMYKTRPRVYGDFSVYVSDPSDDEAINFLASIFKNAAAENRFSHNDTINLIISFVQSLKYTTDKATSGYDEYPRYPVETLIEEGGDCEDTAILMSSILKAMGLNVVMIQFQGRAGGQGHIGVGLAIQDPSSFSPPYKSRLFTDEGVSYAYIETTVDNYMIGQMPEEYESASGQVVHLSPKALIRIKGTKSLQNESQLMVKVEVANIGTSQGEVTAHLMIECEGKAGAFSQDYKGPFIIKPGQSAAAPLVVNKPPSGSRARINITVYTGSQRTDYWKSDWFNVP